MTTKGDIRPRRFRIMGGPSVPWHLVAPFESVARANHDQTLERLNERGGLSPAELWCMVHGKDLREIPEESVASAWLATWLSEDLVTQLDEARAERDMAIGERDALRTEVDRLTRVHAGDVAYGTAEHQEMYTPLAMRLVGERDAAVRERDVARALHWKLTATHADWEVEALAEIERLRAKISDMRSEAVAAQDDLHNGERVCAALVKERDEALAERNALRSQVTPIDFARLRDESEADKKLLRAERDAYVAKWKAARVEAEELWKRIPTIVDEDRSKLERAVVEAAKAYARVGESHPKNPVWRERREPARIALRVAIDALDKDVK